MTDLVAAEQRVAAELIERLLTDPMFRAAFRQDPAGTCREAGLDGLAEELEAVPGAAMMTLEVRESRSSLAGVMIAAAMEGVGIYEFTKHVVPHLEDAASGVGGVLSRVNLPAVKELVESTAGAAAPGAAPPPAAVGADGLPLGADADLPTAAAPGAQDQPIAAAVAPVEEVAAKPKAAAAAVAPVEEAAAKPKAAAAAVAPVEEAAAKPKAAAPVGPAPETPKTPEPRAPELPTSAPLPDVDSLLPKPHGVLDDPALTLDDSVRAAFADGRADDRLGDLLETLGRSHELTVGGIGSDGLSVDITTVDGELVRAGSPAARELTAALADLDPRPASVGSPFSISEPGFVTDPAHGDRIHVAFDAPGAVPTPPPLPTAAPAGAEAAAAPVPAPEAKAAVAAPEAAAAAPEAKAAVASPEAAAAAPSPDVAPEVKAATPDVAAPKATAPVAEEASTSGSTAPEPVASPEAVAAAPAASAPPPPADAAGAADAADAGKAEPSLLAPRGDGTKTDQFAALPAGARAAGAQRNTASFLAAPKPVDAEPRAAAAGVGPPAAAAADALTVGGGAGGYPGDDAPKEQIALWMARRAEAAGLPPELPVMASLVESNLSNLDYGDASSEGYFQMLTTLWDTGKYQGFQKDPEKQIEWFIDHAGPLKARFGALPHTAENLGTWVADTERPAAQYRYRYALRFDEARALIEKGKASGGGGSAVVDPPPSEPQGGSGSAADAAATAPSHPPDPTEYGQDGTGGAITPEGEALLKNPNIHFDEVGMSDLKAGRIDPRVVGLLTKISEKHEITVSCMCSDHPRLTTNGSVSNHTMGRGADIATIDGEIVRPGSPAARELATELSEIEPDIRPDEVGTPFQIAAPGYFSDAAHQNHIHIGFKAAITPDWKPPADVAATDGGSAPVAATAAAAGAPPEAPGAVAAPKGTATGRFLALSDPKAAASADVARARTGAFLALRPAGPAAAVAAAADVPPAVADPAAAGASDLGAAALQVAKGELGVREAGVNTGVEVDKYLAAAGAAPGNPWCASFVTWALEQSGHKMPGGGWAAVRTWVQSAEAGSNDLQVVSADQARPGDIVAYDWGGQDDFGSDGHIGFVASKVENGRFTALEGNSSDAVMEVPRQVGAGGANIKFLRVAGDAPAAPAAPTAPAPPADVPGAAPDLAAAAVADVSTAYPGDNATKEQIAAWMAKLAEERGLPRELPLMASLVESGMRNLNYGDADSIGFFQMRTSYWDRGDYAGFGAKPELQVKWFLDQADAVKRQRIARGLPIDDPKQYGEWIADVERPAESLRYKYQLRLGEAENLLKQGNAHPVATPEAGAAVDAVAAAGDPEAPGVKAAEAIAEARKYLGTPYQWGGASPQTGFDCSGLMQWAYAKAGIQIPRVAEDQLHFSGGESIDRAHLREGDLVGFADASGYVHHIGMYIGNGQFLHAPHTGDVVKVSSLDEPYYQQQFAGGMRVDTSAPTGVVPEPQARAAASVATPPQEPAPGSHRSKTDEFLAIKKQEASFHRQTAMFLKAISPEAAAAHAAGASPEEIAAAAAGSGQV